MTMLCFLDSKSVQLRKGVLNWFANCCFGKRSFHSPGLIVVVSHFGGGGNTRETLQVLCEVPHLKTAFPLKSLCCNGYFRRFHSKSELVCQMTFQLKIISLAKNSCKNES